MRDKTIIERRKKKQQEALVKKWEQTNLLDPFDDKGYVANVMEHITNCCIEISETEEDDVAVSVGSVAFPAAVKILERGDEREEFDIFASGLVEFIEARIDRLEELKEGAWSGVDAEAEFIAEVARDFVV